MSTPFADSIPVLKIGRNGPRSGHFVYFFDQTPHAMALVDHTGWKLRRRQWTGTTEQLIEELKSTYDNATNMFSIRIHHDEKFLSYPGRMYISGRVDIFDMVDIDLFTVIALNMMVLKLGYTGSIAANRTEKMLLLTWHESSETTNEPVCESVLPSSLLQYDLSTRCKDSVCESITPRSMPDCILTPPIDESVITYTQLSGAHGVDIQSHVLPTIQSQLSDINLSFVSQQATASQVIDDVMRQLSFDETELDEETSFADVAGSGVDSLGLSHDESFGVDDLDLNLNEPVNLNVSQVETQSELHVSEGPDVGPTQEPILAKVSTQEPIVTEVSTQEPIVTEVSTEAPIVKEVGTQEFSIGDVVSSGEDVEHGTDDDDDVDGDFLVDEKNEIIETDVDVYLFGISMDLPFDNIGITNLVPDNVLEREELDVINADGFDSDTGNDEERNYRKRWLAELRTKMEGVINASGQRKYSFYTGQKFTSPKEAKDRVYLHSIESRRNLKLYKNDSVRIRARCERKIIEQVRVNPDILVKAVQDQLQRELEVQISMSKAFRAKAKAEREIKGDHVLQYSMLRDYVVELQSTNPNTTVKIAVERNIDPSLPTRVFKRIYVCLGALKLGFRACRRDLLVLDGAFMKGPFPSQVLVAAGLDSNNGIYPLAYALVEAKTKSSWCWFLQCLGGDIYLHANSNFTFTSDRKKGIIPAIKTVYPSAEHKYCLRHIHENMKQGWCGKAYKDLLWRAASATNVKDFKKCMLELKTMNPKAHEWLDKIPTEHWDISHFSGRDKPVITLLEYIREYWMKRIVNVQGVIDKCTGPFTPTATRIIESIKKEAYLMKVQWNGANKYQVSGSLGDHCVVDVGDTTPRNLDKSLLLVKYMEGNILSQDTTNLWDQLLGEVHMSNNSFAIQASCPGGNDAEGSGSASRQAQQTEPTVGQDGSGGSGAAAVIGLSAAGGEGGTGDPGSAGVATQCLFHTRWTRRKVQTERISPQKRTPTQPASQPSTSSQVVSQTRNGDGKEIGDGVPTQSSAAGGASEWSFL
uniref:MULE transposase domain-containing protein n=1 Tax=Tanacetum cinerariifolium TaxID=118510 RepID=A0A699GWJ2_TANCI|nr:hypothetical protein [Tanacetum cinerariifolium]